MKANQDRELSRHIARMSSMGEIRVKARLRNKTREVTIDAVADTGAVMVLLPQDMVERLGLRAFDKRIVVLANEQKMELDIAGPFSLKIGDREMNADCLVGPPGCEPLIGQIVLEALDLVCDPVKRTLTPRPESPFLPTLKLKALSLSLG